MVEVGKYCQKLIRVIEVGKYCQKLIRVKRDWYFFGFGFMLISSGSASPLVLLKAIYSHHSD